MFKLAYVLSCAGFYCSMGATQASLDESIFYDCSKYVQENEKESICADGVKVFWIDSKFPMDLREKSVLDSLKENSRKIFSRLAPDRWMLATCELVKNNGAKGLKREWKGDISKNINANIFIPVSLTNGDSELLSLILHRAISVAIYNVLKAKLGKYCPEKSEKIKLKWINDVIIDEKKICGIKPDDFVNDKQVVSYQFGINVNMPQRELDKIDQPATSLSVECGRNFDHNEIIKEVVTELIDILKKYKDDLKGLDKLFSGKMAFIGDQVIVYDAYPGKNVEGVLESVELGRIFIRTGVGELVQINPGYGILRKTE